MTLLLFNNTPPDPTPIDSNIPLFIAGGVYMNSNIPLYIYGYGISTKVLNLFCKAIDPIPKNNSIPLFIKGGSFDEASNNLTLYIKGEPVHETLNLFISGREGGGSVNSLLNLFIDGYMRSLESSIPLYIHNDTPFSSIPLYIRGEGITDGALPANNQLNLYLERPTSNVLTLYLRSELPTTGVLNLFTQGAYVENEILNLSIPYVLDVKSSVITLYVHGF